MMIRRKANRRAWSPSLATTEWGESTYAELSWGKSRGAAKRWGIAGAVVGTLVSLVAFAPAAWLASSVASATQQRVMLADARGTVWSGSATVVLTGGADSRDASALPGRLNWTLGLRPTGLELHAQQTCCLNGDVVLQIQPGPGRTRYTLVPPSGWVAQWPTAFLAGLGTPWNTLQLGGTVRITSPALKLEQVQGRWLVDGQADIDLVGVSSRLTTLDTLGSYRMSISGSPATPGVSQLTLSTQEGALQLHGSGTWGPAGVRFRGEAQAAPTAEQALTNLLNIIGRRDGARSVISIG